MRNVDVPRPPAFEPPSWATSPEAMFAPVKRAPRRRRWLVILIVLACLVAVATVGVVWLRSRGGDYPVAWDAKVQPYAAIVEKQRNLKFEHPIYVDFLPEADFDKLVTADEADLTTADPKELVRYAALFGSLGLVEGDLDLSDTTSPLRGSATIGYYSYADERIRLRDTEMTPALESTLVHELTHALQDQQFDLGNRFAEIADDPAASNAFDALVDGDARRMETTWRESLTAKELKVLDESLADQDDGSEEESSDIPKVLKTRMAAPNVFGEALTRVAFRNGGERAVDDLYLVPPTTEEQLFDPWTLVADHQGYLAVAEPDLAAGEVSFDNGPFGAISWLLMLAERLPIQQALTATDGWGGDSFVAFDRDGVSCVKINYAGDTPQDLQQMQAALTAWVDQAPDGSAQVRRQGSMLAFESCDPGSAAPSAATGHSMDAVRLAVKRTHVSVTLVVSGFTPALARCSADRLVRVFTTAELNDPELLDKARVQQVIAPCRSNR